MRASGIIAASIVAASFACCVRAQDLSVAAIIAPGTACALGTSESVTIRLFNYGTNLPAATSFNVAYTVNAGSPVVEMVVLGSPLLAHGTFAYTFTTPLDASVPGSYIIGATVGLAGDVNPANDALNGHVVTNWAPSIGGSVSGPLVPVLAGTVSLSGWNGDILEWQQSDDGGRRWRRLANTTALQAFDPLLRDTAFRARVRNGVCAPVLSDVLTVASSDPLFHSGFEQ